MRFTLANIFMQAQSKAIAYHQASPGANAICAQ
jgi:hypothetical protein